MPTNRRPRRRARKTELEMEQMFSLLIGGYGHAFASAAERRAAWAQHREELLARENPGHRPRAWWDYEAPEPRGDEHQTIQLLDLGVIGEAERAKLEGVWLDYERPLRDGPFGVIDLPTYYYHRRFRGIPDDWKAPGQPAGAPPPIEDYEDPDPDEDATPWG